MTGPTSDDTQVIMVFGAHLDDEVIGAGGLLALEGSRGSTTIVVTFTENQTAFDAKASAEEVVKAVRFESKKASSILHISKRISLGLGSNAIADDAKNYQECVRLIRQYRPQLILTHNPYDKHRDHRNVSAMVQEAAWKASQKVFGSVGEPWNTPKLYMFEVFEPFSRPSNVVDITESLERKLEAMRAYESQAKVIPGVLDFIEAAARVRGFLIGTRYGEAYLQSHFLPRRGL